MIGDKLSTKHMESNPDFTLTVFRWIPSRKKLEQTLKRLTSRVERHQPDLVVIVGIPRHHAKKVAQQPWACNYYLSKEPKTTTGQRIYETGSPTPITVVYSRFPTVSEQWFPLTESGFAQAVEVCIPINAWRPDRSPLGLLQEYQVTYDQVSTLTVICAATARDGAALLNGFDREGVRNTTLYIGPSFDEESSLPGEVLCGTTGLFVCCDLLEWTIVASGKLIGLSSTLGENMDENEDWYSSVTAESESEE